ITPLGIALNSLQKYGQDFLSATVNGKKVRLFNVRQQTVADALLLADVKPEELIPKKGKSLNFSLNGEAKIVSGEYGQPAEIYVNGELGSIQTVLNLGDDIVIKPAGPGSNAIICIKDIIEYYNEENIEVIVNDHISNLNYLVNEGDLVEIKVLDEKKSEDKILEEILIEEVENNSINQVAMEIEDEIEEKVNRINVVINGEIVLIEGNQPDFIFIDVFNYIKFDIRNRQGNIVLKLNGNKASYTDIINEDDVIDIYWE
ncbi:MAG: cell division protein FtsA, partial [Clostridiales bacterium]|nr:cell division protein FtsA [Clostridiales bacterium]